MSEKESTGEEWFRWLARVTVEEPQHFGDARRFQVELNLKTVEQAAEAIYKGWRRGWL